MGLVIFFDSGSDKCGGVWQTGDGAAVSTKRRKNEQKSLRLLGLVVVVNVWTKRQAR